MLDAVHEFEYVFALDLDLYAEVAGQAKEPLAECVERGLGLVELNEHGHSKQAAQDGLADIKNISVILGQFSSNRRNNSAAVSAIRGVEIRSTAGSFARFRNMTARLMAPVSRNEFMK